MTKGQLAMRRFPKRFLARAACGVAGVLLMVGVKSSPCVLDTAVHDRSSALRTLGLGNQRHLSDEDIRRAFRREVFKTHPDRNDGDPQRFEAVKTAYDILTGKITERQLTTQAHGRPSWTTGKAAQHKKKKERRRSGGAYWSRYESGENGWVPHVHSQPADLDDVWQSVGYNPYAWASQAAQEHTSEQTRWSWKPRSSEPHHAAKSTKAGPSTPRAAAAPAQSSQPAASQQAAVRTAGSAMSAATLLCLGLLFVAIPTTMRSLVYGSGYDPPDTVVVAPDEYSGLRPSHSSPIIGSVGTIAAPKHVHNLEYVWAATAAKARLAAAVPDGVAPPPAPVLFGGHEQPPPEVIRQWFAQPGKLLDGAEHMRQNVRDDFLLKFWEAEGHRLRDFKNSLVAALDEPHTWGTDHGHRYGSIAAVVDQDDLVHLMQLLDEDADAGLAFPKYQAVSDRRIVQLGRPATGQSVIIVGAGTTAKAGDQLSELRNFLEVSRPDIVVFDLTEETWQQVQEDFPESAQRHMSAGIQFMDPEEFQHFDKPAWKDLIS